MEAQAMNLALSLDTFTEKDFVAAFNEWGRRSRENPPTMDQWMQDLLHFHKGDHGTACTKLIFSILHDLKGKP